jgi:hypothetical protein
MTNIFINILILLKHQLQVVKYVFLIYHLTIESNTPHLLYGSTEITFYILHFRHTKLKIFYL